MNSEPKAHGYPCREEAGFASRKAWINLEAKKVHIKSEVLVGPSEVNHGSFKVDSWLFGIGIGIGKRF